MKRQGLVKSLGIEVKDLYSADSITLSIETKDDLTREELYLKEMGSPTPRIDVYQNIHCVMFHSGISSNRWALLCLDQRGPDVIEETDWLQETAKSGVAVVGTDITVKNSAANTLSRILRVVSYLDLRRDIVDAQHTLVCGTGEYGLWALIAGILDERVAGIIIIEPPAAVYIPDHEELRFADLVELFLREKSRDLAILGIPDNDTEQIQTVKEIQGLDRSASLHIEKESNKDLIKQTILSMTGRERT
jgi:hypothetical protein